MCFLEGHYLILHTLQLYVQLNSYKTALIDLFIEVSDLFVVCSQLGGNIVFASAVRTEVTQHMLSTVFNAFSWPVPLAS